MKSWYMSCSVVRFFQIHFCNSLRAYSFFSSIWNMEVDELLSLFFISKIEALCQASKINLIVLVYMTTLHTTLTNYPQIYFLLSKIQLILLVNLATTLMRSTGYAAYALPKININKFLFFFLTFDLVWCLLKWLCQRESSPICNWPLH